MLEPIEEAIELAQAGRKSSARVMLLAMLEDDPTDEEAWLWLAYCAANADEYSHAIDKLLQLNPRHATAKRLRKQVAQREIFEQTGRDVLAERESRRMLWVRQMVGLVVITFLLFGGLAIVYVLQAPESDNSTPRIITATPQPTPISSLPLTILSQGENVIFLTDSDNFLYVMNAAGQAFLVAENARFPSLSPDGKRLLLVRDDSLVMMDLASNQTTLILAGESFSYPSWAGENIIFTADNTLWQIDARGKNREKLAENVRQGVISPQGSLAYTTLEGSLSIGEKMIENASHAAWASDGTMLAYQSSVTGGTHLYIHDMERGETEKVDFLSGGFQPVWWGESLIFNSRRTGTPDIFVFEDGKITHVFSGDVQHMTAGTLGSNLSAYGEKITLDGQWVAVQAAVNSSLYDVDFISTDSGLAVGENGTILRYQNGVWSRMDVRLNERVRLFGVEMLSENEAWAVGERGTIVHFVNGRWEQIASPTQETLPDLIGNTSLRFENGAWQVNENTPENLPPNILDTDGDWSVGYGGLMMYQNVPIPKVTFENLYGISHGWAVGENGTLLHFSMENADAPLETPLPTFDSWSQVVQQKLMCFVLQGEYFYEYRLIFEPLQEDDSLLATGILPDYSLVLLEGELTPDELLLREDSVLRGDYRVQGQVSLRLEDGQLQGSVITDSEELAAEIVGCKGDS